MSQETNVADTYLLFYAGPDQVLDPDPGISKPKLKNGKKFHIFFFKNCNIQYFSRGLCSARDWDRIRIT